MSGKGLVTLLEAGRAASTRAKYRAACLEFIRWCEQHNRDFSTDRQFDETLASYLCFLYDNGFCYSKACATVFGCVMYDPVLKPHLLMTRAVLTGFRKLTPVKVRPPVTWDMAVCVAVQMLRHGRRDFALATLLGFDCLLRVSELFGLRVRDVVDTGDARLGSEFKQMALSLQHTKTGPNRWVLVLHPEVRVLLRRAVAGRAASDFVFDAGRMNRRNSQAAYRGLFKKCCGELGLRVPPDSQFLPYTPHSLRHGGATQLVLLSWRVEDIMLRGRWASTKSARYYLQNAPSYLSQQLVPPVVQRCGPVFREHLVSTFSVLSQ